jgi:hypothetical protein
METTNSETTTQKEQRPAHNNIVSKIACGQGDWPLMLLVENSTPKEALSIVEKIIVKEVNCNHWRNLISDSKKSDARKYLLDIWLLSVNEVYKNQIVEKLFDLIDQMVAAFKGGITNPYFDAKVTEFISFTLLLWITSCPSDNETNTALWHKFFGLADKRDPIICDRCIFNKDDLSSQFHVFRWIEIKKVIWLIKNVPQTKCYGPFHSSLAEKALEWLWSCLAKENSNFQKKCSQIIHSMMEFDNEVTSSTVIEACTKAVSDICNFSKAIKKLELTLRDFGSLIRNDLVTIKADYSVRQISEVIVCLNTNHYDFFRKKIIEQKCLAHKCTDKIKVAVSNWAIENNISGRFVVTVSGTFTKPQQESESLSDQTEDFKSVAILNTKAD